VVLKNSWQRTTSSPIAKAHMSYLQRKLASSQGVQFEISLKNGKK
jgi:hypothetical protein